MVNTKRLQLIVPQGRWKYVGIMETEGVLSRLRRQLSGACRPIFAEKCPLDIFQGARIHCVGVPLGDGAVSKSFPTAVGKYPRSGG